MIETNKMPMHYNATMLYKTLNLDGLLRLFIMSHFYFFRTLNSHFGR